MGLRDTASGHLWTIAGTLWPASAPPSEPWSCFVPAPWGQVRIEGRITRVPGASHIAIIVHGFAGSHRSGSVQRTAHACSKAGISSLRLSLRGADACGEDIYHAGLVEEVHAAIVSPEVTAYDNVVLIGHSLGGHVVLNVARTYAPKLRAVAAIGTPLDLSVGCASIDRLRATGYREHILLTLRRVYRAFLARHPEQAPADLRVVERLRTIRAWDEHVVIRRHGFASVDDYHVSQSVARHLHALTVPALYLGSAQDPMVPYATVEPILRRAPSSVEVHIVDGGGHVVFPRRVNLGLPADAGADAQVLAWLRRQTR